MKQWQDHKYPQTIAQRIRGKDNAHPHMDGTSTVTFSKYADRPGQFTATIPAELSDLLVEASDEILRLENELTHVLLADNLVRCLGEQRDEARHFAEDEVERLWAEVERLTSKLTLTRNRLANAEASILDYTDLPANTPVPDAMKHLAAERDEARQEAKIWRDRWANHSSVAKLAFPWEIPERKNR